MTTHLTLRLAWHNDGWNGRICQNPAKNTYCVGCSSYPGEMIRETRDLEWEKRHAGRKFSELDKPAACMYSGSAFAEEGCEVLAEPPEFFKDDTQTKYWTLPPATACTWPYEAMYNRDDIKIGNRYDYDKRLQYSEEHFAAVENNKSLVFYYANYSNPLSDDESPRYLLVGVARIKSVASTLYYDGCSQETLERYKGFIWQRGVSSHYPEQGVRLPYHRYIHRPDVLQQFAAYPENSNLCKYATKQVNDDEALGLLETLLESLRIVRDDVQDDSENWTQRIEWLESLIAELWRSRGAYPGMPAVLEFLGLKEAISGFRQRVEQGQEQAAFEEVKQFCEGKADCITGYFPLDEELDDIRRELMLSADKALPLLLNQLSRIALNVDQINAIVSNERNLVGLTATLTDIEANPYLLAEQYQGMDQADQIRWSQVDRGMLPSPSLSAEPLFKKNAKQRLRALLLETLRGFAQQTFVSAPVLIEQVNRRIRVQPEWKQNLLNEQYLAVDKAFYDGAIYQREEEGTYLYDLRTWEDERLVQSVLDKLLTAPEISLKRPVTGEFWHKLLYRDGCSLAEKAKQEYAKAVEVQKEACQQIINLRLAAITGGAGTGKSSVVAALIRAIRKAHGDGLGIAVVAPTGKATDRLRSALEDSSIDDVGVATIHSLLAEHGWLNENLTFKRAGGKPLASYSTIIIDESSMIDLTLMAALFRAIDWNHVSRLILVGDAAQLPPIGIGKVYADIVAYLRERFPVNFVELTENLRQLENRATGKGCGILDLAACFINRAVKGEQDETQEQAVSREKLLARLHEGGEVDKDLSVFYWHDEERLAQQIIDQVVADFTTDESQTASDAEKVGRALQGNINAMQILSPVRGELYGTENINLRFQAFKSSYWLERGAIDGIAMFDKVIQIRNVQKRFPLTAYNFNSRTTEKVQIFNGEIGSVVPNGNWKAFFSKSRWPGFRLKDFSVQFTGKQHLSVNYCTNANNKPESNLELAYAISVHKAQGSEFDRIYFVLPKGSASSQMMELIYTALTRASSHCTVFVQGGVEAFINNMRPEQSALKSINSSLFEFKPVNELIATKKDWYEAGKIHRALAGDMVRSKSEVIIANMLHERGITFFYEKPLVAKDGSMYLPDFTLMVHGEEYYWEHLGMLDKPEYKAHWKEKETWYGKYFPGQLLTTSESGNLSDDVDKLIKGLLKR